MNVATTHPAEEWELPSPPPHHSWEVPPEVR